MQTRHYLDPMGSRLPALERNILRLRLSEMFLVLFYAEQIKRIVLNLVQRTDSYLASITHKRERVPKHQKNQVKQCLNVLVTDGVITAIDRDEIRRLFDYRNRIGHNIHELVADLGNHRWLSSDADVDFDGLAEYDYAAVDRLRHYVRLLSQTPKRDSYLNTIDFGKEMINPAERVILDDIKRIRAKISRHFKLRMQQIQSLNEHLDLPKGTKYKRDSNECRHKYNNNRLTKRGEEMCYRLFDQDKPPIVVAHIMGISLVAARNRLRMWHEAGGAGRCAIATSE